MERLGRRPHPNSLLGLSHLALWEPRDCGFSARCRSPLSCHMRLDLLSFSAGPVFGHLICARRNPSKEVCRGTCTSEDPTRCVPSLTHPDAENPSFTPADEPSVRIAGGGASL